jgi:hypothetical protein
MASTQESIKMVGTKLPTIYIYIYILLDENQWDFSSNTIHNYHVVLECMKLRSIGPYCGYRGQETEILIN